MFLSRTFAATPLDRASIPQNCLDITERVRTNQLPWSGQFSPQLVEELLNAYAPPDGVLLDPFAGSGTSLVEAARQGLAADGIDINPAAVMLARVYEMANLDLYSRDEVLDELRRRLDESIGQLWDACGPLFENRGQLTPDGGELEAALVEMWHQLPFGSVKDLAAALVILSDFHKRPLVPSGIRKAFQRLEQVVRGLPETDQPITMHHADARDLPIETDSVDLVLTSPPYINVHNYHQQFRRSAEALEFDVLSAARSEIGSNRQNRGNRFLTVIQYSLDMTLALREMKRVVKPDGRLILVVGRESKVRGTRFFNGELAAELASECTGFGVERRQERVFRNRFGNSIHEDIIHLLPTGETPSEKHALAEAQNIAAQMLIAARPLAPAKEIAGLEEAIERVRGVSPSPMMNYGYRRVQPCIVKSPDYGVSNTARRQASRPAQ